MPIHMEIPWQLFLDKNQYWTKRKTMPPFNGCHLPLLTLLTDCCCCYCSKTNNFIIHFRFQSKLVIDTCGLWACSGLSIVCQLNIIWIHNSIIVQVKETTCHHKSTRWQQKHIDFLLLVFFFFSFWIFGLLKRTQ